MNKITLVVLAAGMGNRFKNGMKQLAHIGPCGETLIDYAIYDAMKAGIDEVLFVIRHDFEQMFREQIGDRIAQKIPVKYVYQETNKIPYGYKSENRLKPWGTGHALLCCKNTLDNPFITVNADDFYGYKAYEALVDFLYDKPDNMVSGMIGYHLINTLSENGSVNRGICKFNNGLLSGITETRNIVKKNRTIYVENSDKILRPYDIVAVNMFAFSPAFIDALDEKFKKFLDKNIDNPDAEFVLPEIVNELLSEDRIEMRCFKSNEKWFGITYANDVNALNIVKHIDSKNYPSLKERNN